MKLSLDLLLDLLRQGSAYLAELLQARRTACLMCGQSIIRSGQSPAGQNSRLNSFTQAESLCDHCLRSIPWIGEIRCFVCGRPVHCDDCARRSDAALIGNRSAVRYDPVMRGWLALYKYRGKESLAPILARMLHPAFEQLSATVAERQKADRCGSGVNRRIGRSMPLHYSELWDAVTYVPLSEARALERGFNQAEQLAAGISRAYGIPLFPLLARRRDTQKQSFKTRAERIRDTRSLFIPASGAEELLRNLHIGKPILRILVIDDIYTTGSTVHDCARAISGISPVPAELYSLTWARS
ncbi:ComF family protein [Paenibacillus tarimensis]